jgi:hypothetical protein
MSGSGLDRGTCRRCQAYIRLDRVVSTLSVNLSTSDNLSPCYLMAGWSPPIGTWQRSKMGVDIHLEAVIAHPRIQKRTRTFPRLKLRVRAPSLAYRANFDRDRITLVCGLSSLKVELIPFSQSICQRID